jgi:hypothetical protein
MLGNRQACGLCFSDALYADLADINVHGASPAKRAREAPHAVQVPSVPLRAAVGVLAWVPAGVAGQDVVAVGLQPCHSRTMPSFVPTEGHQFRNEILSTSPLPKAGEMVSRTVAASLGPSS